MDDRTQALISELRVALDDLEEGQGDRERVAELAGAIERRLQAEAEVHDDDDTLVEELREAAVRLEAEHPRLAGVLRRAVDLLGGIGL